MRDALRTARRALRHDDVPIGAVTGDLCRDPRLNHRVSATAGVLGPECGRLLVEFFRARRAMLLLLIYRLVKKPSTA